LKIRINFIKRKSFKKKEKNDMFFDVEKISCCCTNFFLIISGTDETINQF